ncbi:MAG: beta-galactosidase [Candidatus Brocadiaceae bacterium]|nr:beta-galactosidase [Candidatus Brocadiaceae bacterium]
MKIGVTYYPEHWSEDRWLEDARLMRKAGVEFVRLGEYAWWRLEPRRAQFDSAWLDKAIETVSGQGLKVIFCTPTAAPPPWLFVRHPSIPPRDADDTPWCRGSRRHVCLNNRPYRRYVRRIMRDVARAFAANPSIYAWQVHSGLGAPPATRCYCDDCEQAFREWLKRRYGIIDRVNRLWGTGTWSQHFNDWHEIPAPRRTPGGPHPSLALDYDRFVSATCRDFVAEQRELIEQYTGDQKPIITTDPPLLEADRVDGFEMAGQLNVVGLSNEPGPVGDPARVALALDLARSVKGRPFWVLGQQTGAVTRDGQLSVPRPGQLRLWSFQTAAHGAEMVVYGPWHTLAVGQQMLNDGLWTPEGPPGRRYDEVAATAAELAATADCWMGRPPMARAAMVLDLAAYWALQAGPALGGLDYMAQFEQLYRLLRRRGIAVDLLAPGQKPDEGHSLLVVPMPVILREQDAAVWRAFAEAGGTVFVTSPAGQRTVHNTVEPTLPNPCDEAVGCRVSDWDLLPPGRSNSVVFPEAVLSAGPLCCILDPDGAEPLASYGGEHYAGRPAFTRVRHGEGALYMLGAAGGIDLLERALGEALGEARLEAHPWASETVEVVPLRVRGGEPPLTFVLNHGDEPAALPLPEGQRRRDLITGHEHTSDLSLQPYGVALLQG